MGSAYFQNYCQLMSRVAIANMIEKELSAGVSPRYPGNYRAGAPAPRHLISELRAPSQLAAGSQPAWHAA